VISSATKLTVTANVTVNLSTSRISGGDGKLNDVEPPKLFVLEALWLRAFATS
jgi:hypothetical protein